MWDPLEGSIQRDEMREKSEPSNTRPRDIVKGRERSFVVARVGGKGLVR